MACNITLKGEKEQHKEAKDRKEGGKHTILLNFSIAANGIVPSAIMSLVFSLLQIQQESIR